jgi:hypothetical protein
LERERVKLRDLPGWPPKHFQHADLRREHRPPVHSLLFIEDAALLAGAGSQGEFEIVLFLRDRGMDVKCVTRLGVESAARGFQVAQALNGRRGLSLSIAGDAEIGAARPDGTKLKS